MKKKPSWFMRSMRRKLVSELESELKEYGIEKAWVHNHFIRAEEKRVKNITIYIDINNLIYNNIDINKLEVLMDKKFIRKKINIIDIASLQPSIKDFVFKDITPLF